MLKTFEFGPSSTTADDLDKYSELGWFTRSNIRHNKGKVVPKPSLNEAVVFRDFFLVGFRVPTSKFVGALMEKYETYLHHRTPNSLMIVSKFVMETFGEESDIDCFGSFYELHYQGLKRIVVEGEVKDAKFARCTFIPRRAIGKTEKVCLSFAQRKRWDDDWYRHGFYIKVNGLKKIMPSGKALVRYPLAFVMGTFKPLTKIQVTRSEEMRLC